MRLIVLILLALGLSSCITNYLKPNTFSNTRITNNLLYDNKFFTHEGSYFEDRDITGFENKIKSLRDSNSPEDRNLYAIYNAKISYWLEAETVWKDLISKEKNKFFF
ncbi:MAG: hypothetical protein H7A24_01410 [Leptospiraceae bacterium]|nr:hypothetical protein [Leptospiraceae bacterium]MCP5510511.1 hypothetical protein [Leptospiraceae bacterium]